MREIPVVVGEVDRHVLVAGIDAELGLISCVSSRVSQMARHSNPWSKAQGGLLVPVSGVDEAEGRDRDQVGEEAIGGKRLTGTSNTDMTQR